MVVGLRAGSVDRIRRLAVVRVAAKVIVAIRSAKVSVQIGDLSLLVVVRLSRAAFAAG